MLLEEFFRNSLGLPDDWKVQGVEQDNEKQEVNVKITYQINEGYRCPKCRRRVYLHDWRTRKIEDLNTGRYRTYLIVRHPRVDCPRCGNVAIEPPFAAPNSRFSKEFENKVIRLCDKASNQKVSEDLGINWHVIEAIKDRALKRGEERQQCEPERKVRNISIDETSFRKRHDYVTIISDADRGTVLAAIPGRDADTVIKWFRTQDIADFSCIRSISMDMAPPYIKAIQTVFGEQADSLICFDRFHVAQLFSRAVDTIRRREAAEYRKDENPFYKMRFELLKNSEKTDNRTSRRRKFLELMKQPFKTAKAWKLKEFASTIWNYVKEKCALKAWKNLLWRLSHSRIPELYKVGETIKEHLTGILNAIRLKASNGVAEARNSCIQRIKNMACGFRDKTRFDREIIFQWGGLDMSF